MICETLNQFIMIRTHPEPSLGLPNERKRPGAGWATALGAPWLACRQGGADQGLDAEYLTQPSAGFQSQSSQESQGHRKLSLSNAKLTARLFGVSQDGGVKKALAQSWWPGSKHCPLGDLSKSCLLGCGAFR